MLEIKSNKINFGIEFDRFKFIKQREGNWCILACIENVLNYFGIYDWSQERIQLEFSKNIEDGLSYSLIKEIIDKTVLRKSVETDLKGNWNIKNDFDYFDFIDSNLKQKIPVFISINNYLPESFITYNSIWESKFIESGKSLPHSILIVEKFDEYYAYFDPDPNLRGIKLMSKKSLLIRRANDWNIAIIKNKSIK